MPVALALLRRKGVRGCFHTSIIQKMHIFVVRLTAMEEAGGILGLGD